MTESPDFAAAAAQEAIDLHVLLQAWFRAEGDASLDDVLAHFDPGFTMITTAGALLSFEQVSAMFAKSRGARPGLVMEVIDPLARHTATGSALVTYLERQTQDGKSTLRWSSGLLLHRPERANPVWRHLHETWVD